MSLDYKVVPLPPVWPALVTSYRSTPPFKPRTAWAKHLEREVGMLNGKNITIAADIEERHLNRMGLLRADARPLSPKVILSFDVKAGRLQFPADKFTTWLANLDAILRIMEDLRRADRYGIRPGAQYSGFKALPATTAPTMSTGQAAEAIVTRSNGPHDVAAVMTRPDHAREAIRSALANTHPDKNDGKSTDFLLVGEARRILSAHHGTTL